MNPNPESRIARGEVLRSFARLFLFEPDAETLNARDLRVEFTRLFALNVFPYASVYLDAEGSLNTATTARVQAAYRRAGFEPDRALPIGAPDHFGAELLFAAQRLETAREKQADEFLRDEVLPWAGVFLYAVERNAREEFYRVLARETRAGLVGQISKFVYSGAGELEFTGNSPALATDEDDLESIVMYLLSPARSGVWLSKDDLARIAHAAELPIGFGDRALMLKNLMRAAGEHERIEHLLRALRAEVSVWIEHYQADAGNDPGSASVARDWLARAEKTQARLKEMERAAHNVG